MRLKAIELAFLVLFINIAFSIIAVTGAFDNNYKNIPVGEFSQGDIDELDDVDLHYSDSASGELLGSFGILALAGLMALSTIVVLGSNLINDRGVAIIVFAVLFYGSIALTGVSVFSKFDFPGLQYIYGVFVLICTLIFVVSLIQMPTGGQKNFV